MIKVFLVDDQNLVRQGVKALLEIAEGMEVIGECNSGQQAMIDIPELQPDVVLLDMRMPGMTGLDVLKELNANNQLPPTIILTTFDDDELVLNGLKSGTKGFLLKDVPLEGLVDGIKKVANGETLIRPQVTKKILSGIEDLKMDFLSFDLPEALTTRETEILRLMAGGHSNKEIANSLFVAEGTVKNHVSNILSKIGVRDRTRAVLKALELGLI
jgi:DNA-binding NarL/FixJ family response regulator